MRRHAKSVLLASAAVAALAVPALAESYFFRTKPLVDPPQAFSFTARSGQNPGATVESDAARVKGHRGKTVAVTGGEYQVCATADCSGAAWTSSPTANVPADFHARVRVTAAGFGQKSVARLAVGDATAAFEVGTRAKDVAPDAIKFPSVGNAQPGVAAKSAAVAVAGHDGVTLSVENGGYQICQTVACSEMDGKAIRTAASGEVASGTLVRLFATPAPYGQTATATLRAGDTVGTFSATARGKDPTPATFQFASKGDQEPNRPSYSAPVTLADFDGAPLSVTGGGYQICAQADCSDQTGGFQTAAIAEVLPGTRVRLVATPTDFGIKATATLTVGAVSASYEATARAKDVTPNAFGWTGVTGTAGQAYIESAVVRIDGHDGVAASITATGTPNAQFRVCADSACASVVRDWSSAPLTNLVPGQHVGLRVTAAAVNSPVTVSLAAGGTTGTWVATPAPAPIAKLVFGTCGASGFAGPTLAQCQATYGASGPVISMTTQGKQEWTVPATGTYRMTVAGARGGHTPGRTGGDGFAQTVEITLSAGEKLTIVVGQKGADGKGGESHGAGGGGASAVRASGGVLVISGGGGGAGYLSQNNAGYPVTAFSGKAATTGEAGSQDQSRKNPAGSSGQGAPSCSGGGHTGGAGWTTGSPEYASWGSAPGALNASALGSQQRQNSVIGHGGFGGGGAGAYGGGGGGGYSGGGCGDYATVRSTGGGAGGSFSNGGVVGTSSSSDHGYVEIERR